MAKKKQTVEDQNLENVQEALNTTSMWIEKNQNKLTWAVTIVVALVVGALALNTYVIKPKAVEVNDENAKAVAYFMQGDWEKALNGDVNAAKYIDEMDKQLDKMSVDKATESEIDKLLMGVNINAD